IDQLRQIPAEPRQQLVAPDAALPAERVDRIAAERACEITRRDVVVGPLADPGLRGFALSARLHLLDDAVEAAAENAARGRAAQQAAETAGEHVGEAAARLGARGGGRLAAEQSAENVAEPAARTACRHGAAGRERCWLRRGLRRCGRVGAPAFERLV